MINIQNAVVLLLVCVSVCSCHSNSTDRVIGNRTMENPGECNSQHCPVEPCTRVIYFSNESLCFFLNCSTSCDQLIQELRIKISNVSNLKIENKPLTPDSPTSPPSTPPPAVSSTLNSTNSSSSQHEQPTTSSLTSRQTGSTTPGSYSQSTTPHPTTAGNQFTTKQTSSLVTEQEELHSTNASFPKINNSTPVRPLDEAINTTIQTTTSINKGTSTTTTTTAVTSLSNTMAPTTTLVHTTLLTTTAPKPKSTTNHTFIPSTTTQKPKGSSTTPTKVDVSPKGEKTIVEATEEILTSQVVNTSSLLTALIFGLLFFVVAVALFLRHAYESYKRRDYTQVDYLINGMYNDSGL